MEGPEPSTRGRPDSHRTVAQNDGLSVRTWLAPSAIDVRGEVRTTSHPLPNSTNLVPYLVAQLRPSRTSTCTFPDTLRGSVASASPTGIKPSSGCLTPDLVHVRLDFVSPTLGVHASQLVPHRVPHTN